MTIQLGDTARDTITGFAGIVTARHEYLNGCVRLSLTTTTLDKDGMPQAPYTVDIDQLELVKATPRRTIGLPPTGGPHDDPQRPAAPRRE